VRYDQKPPPYGYGPHHPMPYPPPPRRRIGRTIGIGLLRLAGAVLVLIVAVAIFGGGNEQRSSTLGRGGTNTLTSDTGPAYPGGQSGDVVATGDGTVTLDGLSVTSTKLRRGDSTFRKTLCTTVTYANGADRTASFGIYDFQLQDPKGAIVNPTYFGGGDGLGSGELAPGGSVSGDVCFEDKAATKGRYIVLYDPSVWSSDRGSFLNDR